MSEAPERINAQDLYKWSVDNTPEMFRVMTDKASCGTCHYFLHSESETEFYGNPRGWCRRYPKWVVKSKSLWCGEWKESIEGDN